MAHIDLKQNRLIYKSHVFLLVIAVILVSIGVVRRHAPLLSTPVARAAGWNVEIDSSSSVEHVYATQLAGDNIDVDVDYDRGDDPGYTSIITALLFIDGTYKAYREAIVPPNSSGTFTFADIHIPAAAHDFDSYNAQVKLYHGAYHEPRNGQPSDNMVLKDTDSATLAHPSDHYNIHVYGGGWSPQISHNENPTPDEDTLNGKFRIWVEDDNTATVKSYVSGDYGNTYTPLSTHGISFQGPPAAYKTMSPGLINLGTFEHGPTSVDGGQYHFKFELYDDEDVLRDTLIIQVPHNIRECNDREHNDNDNLMDHPYDPECGNESYNEYDWTKYTEGPAASPSPTPTSSPSPFPTPSPFQSPNPSASPSPAASASPTPSPTGYYEGYCEYDENGDPIWCS